jgi:phage tail-like protein
MPTYPPPAFSFKVALATGASASADVDAAFQEVSGIESHVETEDVVEGGLNAYVHQLPGVTKHGNLVLKRGYVVTSSSLASWAGQTVGSTLGTSITPQTLNVYLLDASGQPLVTWTFQNAWPIKWEVGTLDAMNSNSVLTQTLEICYTTVTTTLNQAGSAS